MLDPSDVRPVQRVVKDALAVFGLAGSDEASLSELEEAFATEKVDFERSLAASEETLADEKPHMQEC